MRTSIAVALLVTWILGCNDTEPADSYVARVGSEYFTESDLRASLSILPVDSDTVKTSQILIDRWITNELLYQEARKRRLESDADIRQKLEDSERAVLIQSMVEILRMSEDVRVPPESIRDYFEINKENLRLLEPFVHVRHLHMADADSARVVAELLSDAPVTEADSVYESLAMQYAVDPAASITIAGNYFPERQLFARYPVVYNALAAMTPGSRVQVVSSDDGWHVIQLVDRAAAGAVPELMWVEDLIQQQLLVEARKQNYTSAVQQLRMEASARDEIEIRY